MLEKVNGTNKRKFTEVEQDSSADDQDAKVRKTEGTPETGTDASTSEDAPADGWTCTSCTFINHPSLEVCEICDNSRHAIEMLQMQLEDMKHKTNVVEPPSSWQPVDPGTRQRFVELAVDDKDYMDICKTLMTFGFHVSPGSSSSSSSSSKKTRVSKRQPLYSIKKVEQDSSTDDQDAKVRKTEGTPETGTDASTSEDAPADGWTCTSCTFINHPSLEVCEICDNSRHAIEMLQVQLEDMKRKTSSRSSSSKKTRVSKYQPLYSIKKIERNENFHLYQMYSIKKEQMKEENGPLVENEQMLWHGTSPECVGSIASYGFNRSHCGKNGTVLGQGVYFSTGPMYSSNARYAKPDKSGLQYMFYSRVLTGEYTNGHSTMVEPPMYPNKAGRFNSLTDCVPRPSMFVVFHDAQAYPEFLITFTSPH